MQLHFVTVGADEAGGEVTRKRQAAVLTVGWPDETDMRPALAANVAVDRLRVLFMAKLADGRIKQVKAFAQ